MKIGVTGASGQLGRLVVQQLLGSAQATDVVAIVRDPAKAADLAAAGVEIRSADYEDRASLDAAAAGLDRLLLISSNEVGRRFPQHINVIDAAKAAGVKHVVYTSAPKATTSALILAPEHKATEEYLESSGLEYTVLRNNWYTENYAQTVQTARQTGAGGRHRRGPGGQRLPAPTTPKGPRSSWWARVTRARCTSSAATRPGTTTNSRPPSQT